MKMLNLSHLLTALMGNAYHWEKLTFNPNLVRRGGRVAGRKKSIYHKWGFDDDAYHVHLSKAERAGKTWQETQAMRMKIWKQRRKAS